MKRNESKQLNVSLFHIFLYTSIKLDTVMKECGNGITVNGKEDASVVNGARGGCYSDPAGPRSATETLNCEKYQRPSPTSLWDPISDHKNSTHQATSLPSLSFDCLFEPVEALSLWSSLV